MSERLEIATPTLEFPTETTPETNTRRLMHEMITNDEGSISGWFANRAALGVALGTVVLSSALGIANVLRSMDLTHDEYTWSGGKGTVEKVYALDKACNSGYRTHVEGAKAQYEKKLDVGFAHIPFTDKLSAEVNDDISSDWCHKATKVKLGVNEKDQTVYVNIPASSYFLDVRPTNPITYEENIKIDNGLYQAGKRNWSNVLNTVPKVDAKFGEGLEGRLRGYATMYAYRIVADACGEKVVPILEPIEKQSLAKNFAGIVSQTNPRMSGITAADVKVTISGDLGDSFGTQYDKLYKKLVKDLNGSDVEFKLPEDTDLHCSLSPELKQQKAELAAVSQGNTNG